MRIQRIAAHPLLIEVSARPLGLDLRVEKELALVEIQTDEGVVGHGVTGHVAPTAVAPLVHAYADAVIGQPALAHVAIRDRWLEVADLRGQTGIAYHALSAIDLALWDLKGRILGEPVWKLLGADGRDVALYASVGSVSQDRAQLVDLAVRLQDEGFEALKFVVAARAASRRVGSLTSWLREDVAVLEELRAALDDDTCLLISARSSLTLREAVAMARELEGIGVSVFQEPTLGNRPLDVAQLARQTGIATALGHSCGPAERFLEYLDMGALSFIQPNAVTCGGITGATEIAAMARAFGVPVLGGGSWMFHNLPVLAAAGPGVLGEWFPLRDVLPMGELYQQLPTQRGGRVSLPAEPGLGLRLDPDAVRRFRAG